MTCRAGDVSCQLAQIAAALNGWSWPSFTATLVATLVGAAVALAGAAAFAHRDRAERYRTRLDEALAHLIALLASYGEELALHHESLQFRYGRPVGEHPLPSSTQVEAALDVVSLLVRGKDEAFARLIDASFRSAILVFPTKGIDLVRSLPRAILQWRHGEPIEKVRRLLEEARKGYPSHIDPDTPGREDA